MTIHLRQSTAVDVLIGPFVDSTDGYTAETALSPAVKLSKNGQTLGAKNDATTPVHDADGYYNCELDATDTNTIGSLVLTVVGSATSLPVKHEFQVLDEVSYDAVYGDGATILTSFDIGQLYESTVGTVNSQTSFDMSGGISTDDNWIGQVVIIEDASTGDSWVTYVSDVVAASNRILIASAAPFTVVAGDTLRVESRVHPTYALNTYDPPTRTEATSDKAEIKDYVLALIQLATRDDAAIATDRATELGDINANEGSGAGAYDNTTDSLEANQVALAVVDGIVDSILTDTGTTLNDKIDVIDGLIDAIKAKTDDLTFTKANEVDANVQSINGAAVVGDGNATPWDGA